MAFKIGYGFGAEKTFIIAFTFIFMADSLIAQIKPSILVRDLKNANIERGQIIKFKLSGGETIIIKYLTRTDEYMAGELARQEGDRIIITSREIKIYYDTVKDFELFNEPKAKHEIVVYGMMIAAVAFFILIQKLKIFEF